MIHPGVQKGYLSLCVTMLFCDGRTHLSEMSVRAVIPFKPVNPKTRLSPTLNKEERETFAQVMLRDVIDAVQSAGAVPTILSTHPFTCPDADVEVASGGLNDTLNCYFGRNNQAVLLVMADLPLATPESLLRMMNTNADIAIVPGRGGGTNSLFLKDPQKFRADFYGASFLKHMQIATEFGRSVEVVDSFRLHTDIDERDDLVEVLIHNNGVTRDYLVSLGFSLVTEHGRVGVKRDPHKQAF